MHAKYGCPSAKWKPMEQTIMVDIDNTICMTTGVDYKNAKPIFQNIAVINKMYDEGHTIIYWTSRGAKSKIDWRFLTETQLENWGCKYTELRLDKPFFDLLIDDKCIESISFFAHENNF
jgi:hypothetical protein